MTSLLHTYVPIFLLQFMQIMHLVLLLKSKVVDYPKVLDFKVRCNNEVTVPVQVFIDVAPQPSQIVINQKSSGGFRCHLVCTMIQQVWFSVFIFWLLFTLATTATPSHLSLLHYSAATLLWYVWPKQLEQRPVECSPFSKPGLADKTVTELQALHSPHFVSESAVLYLKQLSAKDKS